jgi:hypothetical protein
MICFNDLQPEKECESMVTIEFEKITFVRDRHSSKHQDGINSRNFGIEMVLISLFMMNNF